MQTGGVLVQIYGVTNLTDAIAVDRMRADLVGLVLDEGIATWDSVEESLARDMRGAVVHARVVALSLATDPERIKKTAELLEPDVVHLARAHLMTTETLYDLRSAIARQMMLTVPVVGPQSLYVAERLAPICDYLLLDTSHPVSGVVGATGLTHDWDLSATIVAEIDKPVVLAGGLGPHNVREAIARVQPFGVDSETQTSLAMDRRRKDLRKVEQFIAKARADP